MEYGRGQPIFPRSMTTTTLQRIREHTSEDVTTSRGMQRDGGAGATAGIEADLHGADGDARYGGLEGRDGAENQRLPEPLQREGETRPDGERANDGRGAGASSVSQREREHVNGDERARQTRKTKGRLHIATLNMRGYGARTRRDEPSDKWMCINQLVRSEKIAILAVQETHLTTQKIDELNQCFAATMVVGGSLDPVAPSEARGVAFVINKRFIEVDSLDIEEVIPGRAAILHVDWKSGRKLAILNVYAPNPTQDNADFWKSLRTCIEARDQRRPEIVLGDFNLVENSIDRLPAHADRREAVEELQHLRSALSIIDGWRLKNPSTRLYTYEQIATGSQSRIDRVYLTEALAVTAEEWDKTTMGFPTDHNLVRFSIANYGTPNIGKGRWAIPTMLLTDEIFLSTMRKLTTQMQLELNTMRERTEEENPQRIFTTFKTKLRSAARDRAKRAIPKLDRKIARLNTDLANILNGPDADSPENVRTAGITQEMIATLEERRFGKERQAVAVNDWIKGETVSKYWVRLNKSTMPTTVISELGEREVETNRVQYTNNSKQMANIALRHYNGLQDDPTLDTAQHEEYIQKALKPLEIKLPTRQKGDLAKRLSTEEVLEAIEETAIDKSPGLDGIPAEIWKLLLKWETKEAEGGAQTIQISKAMTMVFNDIEKFGVQESTGFTDGWICPIYKLKKDVREIVNYRPITVLNTDYKIMTRALAARLAKIADLIIHPDQAGFIPGRHIFSQIKLAQTVINFAEKEEINGAIVALDQEKAYDKINHTYLWRTLEKLNFPRNFIGTVKSLYKTAKSCVIVNGMISKSFKVTRGVRQGDPLSCLLFNIAIEPLACALRTCGIQGLEIPGAAENLITNLFADDTTVYLSEHDNFNQLERTLRTWCQGARARFNEEKTEIIPIGMQAFRETMTNRTGTSTLAQTVPRVTRVAQDGEAVRLLGAWIGNNTDPEGPWANVLMTIERKLNVWAKRHPTLYGRKLAVSLEAGARTQFLAKAQTMPEPIEKKLTKLIAGFVWNGDAHPRISRETLCKKIEDGGINLLCIKTRNEAIDVMWLKEYMKLGRERPRWAYLADALIARAVAAASKSVDWDARVNYFLQTWNVSTRQSAGLPEHLRRLVKAASVHGMRLELPKPAEDLKKELPIFYHIGGANGRCTENSPALRCLRERHRVRTVADCAAAADHLNRSRTNHVPRRNCECTDCDSDRRRLGCDNPHRCALAAVKRLRKLRPKWHPDTNHINDGLTLTKRRKKKNTEAMQTRDRVIFDPSITSDPTVEGAMRIFVPDEDTQQDGAAAATRPPKPYAVPDREVEVYTAGVCKDMGKTNARGGCGLWFGQEDRRNEACTLPGRTQTKHAAEIYAVEKAIRGTPPFHTLHIVTPSEYVLKGLTTNLASWEETGWAGIRCAENLTRVVALLRKRSAPTTIRYAKGNAGTEGCDEARSLAKGGISMEWTALPELEESASKYLPRGAKLSAMTQSLAYKKIRERQGSGVRRRTEIITDRICATLEADLNLHPQKPGIWKAIRSKDVPRRIRDFFWKTYHGAQKIGEFWRNIPGYEHRATCSSCGEDETMEHILTECTAPGRKQIWELTQTLLAERKVNLPELSYGLLLGAPSVSLKGIAPKVSIGTDRLTRILLMEATHLIWVIRCERVIGRGGDPEKEHTAEEIRNRWQKKINTRLAMDQALTTKSLGRKATKEALVYDTWRGTLREEGSLPDEWIGLPGVLVGRPTWRPGGIG